MANAGVSLAIAMVVIAAGIFFVKPFPSCALYTNFLIFQTCYQQLTVFGIDPNIFAGAVVLILAIGFAVGLRDREV